MARYTWFSVGGPAEVLFEPADIEDLQSFVKARPSDVPISVIGGTSNILIRDGGIPGITIRLGKAFAQIDIQNEQVRVGAAAADVNVARRAAEAGVAGLEFLVGIPGTIGGALRMNAGAYGIEIKDVFQSTDAITEDGECVQLGITEMGFGYRRCTVPSSYIFIAATLQGTSGDVSAIQARMKDIQESRETTQPVRERTGGSTFANPEGHSAWALVDAAGCRGLKIGGAMVSEAHTNFLINAGDATALDIEMLGEDIRRRVKEDSGIELHWEIRRLGVPNETVLREVTT
jgi:UDP-N-acetylmuramate dehydrogenase